MSVSVKRIYEPSSKQDGMRILVDRIWPRGMSKERAKVDLWLKDVAPSTELRKWFHHDPTNWDEFKRRYVAELKERPEAVAQLKQAVKRGPVTLLFSARDCERNQAIVLKEYLGKRS
jgi:uncharacterized protein YeaO (DUF488 family)